MKAIFEKHDDNKNGVIDKHELPAVLEDSLKRKLPPTLMQKYVSTVFAKHDKDGNDNVRSLCRKDRDFLVILPIDVGENLATLVSNYAAIYCRC